MSFEDAFNSVMDTVNKVFGTTATYTYALDDSTQEIIGVFSSPYTEINNVITEVPTFRIKLSDLSSDPVEPDEIEINSVSYRVMNHQVDSFGGTTIFLQKI